MRSALLQVYYALPYPLRVSAASLTGYRLKRWRYGTETERLTTEYLDRDNWTSYRWKRWREERLAFLLHHAATRVPYYRQHWQERRKKGDRASWEVLANWPILDKSVLRHNAGAFLADRVRPSRMIHDLTSGTTGTPIDLWFSRDTLIAWYAMFEARCRRWHGISRRDPWALLAGQAVADPQSHKPPYWVWNRGLRQLYLSSYHACPSNAEAYVNAMKQHGVRHLVGYPSAAYMLAQGIRRDVLKPPPLEAIITQSEQLYPFQRKLIEEAFQCPVRDSYGMSEICAGASECRHGSMHLWPDAGHVETVDDGEILCTGLINFDMPLIRYRVGDRGRLAPEGAECACGRNLPVLQALEGRVADVIETSDGRQLSPNLVESVFDARLPIEEAQIVQRGIDDIAVLVVPGVGYSEAVDRVIQSGLRKRLGDVRISVEKVDRVPRGPNGKLRAVLVSS